MNIALWTVQVSWAVFFSLTGFGKVLCYKPALWNQALQDVPWFSAVPRDRERHKKENDQKDVQEKKRHEEEDRLEER